MAKKLLKRKSNSVKNDREYSEVAVEKNLGGGKKEILKSEINSPPSERTNRPTNMLHKGEALVGLSKGVTLNLGSYQSARIDVSITRVCSDSEQSIMDNLADISVLLDEQIEYESNEVLDSE